MSSGMPAFGTILQRVAEYYREQRDELRAQNDTLMDVYDDLTPAPVDGGTALGDFDGRQARIARQDGNDAPLRNGEPDGLGHHAVDDEFVARGLLHWKIPEPSTLDYAVDENGRAFRDGGRGQAALQPSESAAPRRRSTMWRSPRLRSPCTTTMRCSRGLISLSTWSCLIVRS